MTSRVDFVSIGVESPLGRCQVTTGPSPRSSPTDTAHTKCRLLTAFDGSAVAMSVTDRLTSTRSTSCPSIFIAMAVTVGPPPIVNACASGGASGVAGSSMFNVALTHQTAQPAAAIQRQARTIVGKEPADELDMRSQDCSRRTILYGRPEPPTEAGGIGTSL